MKSKLFCVRDQKIGSFAEPFSSPTADAAMRALKQAVEAQTSDVGRYPEDFDLYEIAVFNPESGTLEAYSQPKHLTSALAFKRVDSISKSVENKLNG